MAILKAPLMSLGASGALGKALVFFGWKGLDVVREYVVPSNPKTAAQVTQRGYLTEVVTAIHTAQALATNPLDEDDTSAYALLGSKAATPMTWFNMVVKQWIDVLIAAKVPCIYSNGTISSKTAGSFSCLMTLNEKTGSTLAAATFYFGTSKSALIHSSAATVVAGVSVGLTAENLAAFLTAGTKYYMQCKADAADGCEGANSGIYTFVAE